MDSDRVSVAGLCVGGNQQEGKEGQEREGARGPDGIRGPFLGMG